MKATAVCALKIEPVINLLAYREGRIDSRQELQSGVIVDRLQSPKRCPTELSPARGNGRMVLAWLL
jgi:hypothetical protein